MPPVVIAAGIGAAGALGGAALSSRASNKATSASQKANDQALAYTREQDAMRREDYNKAQAQFQQQWEADQARKNALLQRYGVDVSSFAPPQRPQQPSGQPGAVPRAGGQLPVITSGYVPPRAQNAMANGVSNGIMLADVLGRGAEPGAWNDWERNGLRGA